MVTFFCLNPFKSRRKRKSKAIYETGTVDYRQGRRQYRYIIAIMVRLVFFFIHQFIQFDLHIYTNNLNLRQDYPVKHELDLRIYNRIDKNKSYST